MGSTLYADRGPPFGLPGIVWRGGETLRVFCQPVQQVRNLVVDQARAASPLMSCFFPWSSAFAFKPEATRGAEKGDAAQGAVGPQPSFIRAPDVPPLRRALGPVRAPQAVGPASRSRRSSDLDSGGALCRPVSAPAQVSTARMGRERPRRRIAAAAPEAPGGVAHTCADVEDVLGRARGFVSISGTNRPPNSPRT